MNLLDITTKYFVKKKKIKLPVTLSINKKNI